MHPMFKSCSEIFFQTMTEQPIFPRFRIGLSAAGVKGYA